MTCQRCGHRVIAMYADSQMCPSCDPRGSDELVMDGAKMVWRAQVKTEEDKGKVVDELWGQIKSQKEMLWAREFPGEFLICAA